MRGRMSLRSRFPTETYICSCATQPDMSTQIYSYTIDIPRSGA